MKKIICLFLLIQSGYILAQTETLVTVNGKRVQINTNPVTTADNGLTAENGKIQLGGELTKKTAIETSSENTLSIKGLQNGSTSNTILTTDANGVVKTITNSDLSNSITKGNLSSTSGTISISNGSNKLFDGNASLDIKPGTAGQILITDNTNAVKWGTIKDVKGLLVDRGAKEISLPSGTVKIPVSTGYQRFYTNSITVTGPSTIFVKATVYIRQGYENNARAVGIVRIVNDAGNILDTFTGNSNFYTECPNYTDPKIPGVNFAPGRVVPTNALQNIKIDASGSAHVVYGTIDAPTAGTYNFHLECSVEGFSSYSDNIYDPNGYVLVAQRNSAAYSSFSYEVYNK